MRIALAANGQVFDYKIFKNMLTQYDMMIAVDGGLHHLDKAGLAPNIFVGDADSYPHTQLKKNHPQVITHFYPSDKDQTDLELAIELAIEKKPSSVTIFGATGGRTDHILGNLTLLSRYPDIATIESETEIMKVIHKPTTFELNLNQTLSLIPLNGPVEGIETKGLKWELSNATLDKKFIGVSNVAKDKEVLISRKKGDLLCVIQKTS